MAEVIRLLTNEQKVRVMRRVAQQLRADRRLNDAIRLEEIADEIEQRSAGKVEDLPRED